MMDALTKKFLDTFSEYRDELENTIYTNMLLNAMPDDEQKKTVLRYIEIFNAHGVSTKVLFEVISEIAKEGDI